MYKNQSCYGRDVGATDRFYSNGNIFYGDGKMKRTILALVMTLLVCNTGVQAISIDWVTVGNAGNANDATGYGSVGYEYQISKYEVTAGQYIEFLNAVAATDPYGLYNTNMDSDVRGCQITRNGTSGSYTYDFSGRPSGDESDWSNRPVNYVSWYDTFRFINWLGNGQGTSDTETGAYTITNWDGTNATVSNRNAGALVWMLSENEWYKAAYHKNDGVTSNYFDYPTSSDSAPGRDMTEATNTGNNANYYSGNYLIGSPYFRTEVGEFELSDSPYHTFDQGGNVLEWLETVNTKFPAYRILRGGSMGASFNTLPSSYRSTRPPDAESFDQGFRVASVFIPCDYILAGDIDDNCKADLADFAIIAAAWLSDDTPTANWNPDCDISSPSDGFIDTLDLAVLLNNWLTDCNADPSDPACVPK